MAAELFHRIDGPADGPAVLMVHAFPTSHALWEPQVPALAARYRLIRPDLRGLGRSPVPPPPYSMQAYADDLAGLLDRLAIARVHYVGISMGGMIGQVLALSHPGRVRSLALCMTTSAVPEVAPPGDHQDQAISRTLLRRAAARAAREGMAPIAAVSLERWFTPGFIADPAARRLARIVAATSPTGYAGGIDALCDFDIAERLAGIRAPTLVLAAEQDRATPVHCSQVLAAGIPGARLESVPDAGHIANVEQADAVTASLLSHLARQA